MSDFNPTAYVSSQSDQPAATAPAPAPPAPSGHFDPSTYSGQEFDPATYGNHDPATVDHMAADPNVDPADLLGSFETQPLAIQIFKARANQPASIEGAAEGAKDFATSFVKAIPSSVESLGKGTYDWFRNLGEMGVGIARSGGDINNPQTQRAGTENAAAIDLIGLNLASQAGGIGRNASRLANILTGGTIGQRDKDLTDEQILDRLWTQKSAKDTMKATLSGHSLLSDAGLAESPEQLANEGYPIRSSDIEAQASAANPENLLPVGAVLRPGVVAKIAGYGLQGTGKAIEAVGTGLGKAAGGGKSWIYAAYEAVHHDATTAIAAAVAPYVAKGLTKTGGFIKSAGAELTLAPEERAMLDQFNALGGTERGAILNQANKLLQAGATGSVAMAPFAASDETPGQVGSTLGSGFGLGLAGQGAHDATILGRQKAFDSYFKTVNNNGNPLVDLSTQSRDYGTDPSMDAAHNQSMAESSPEEQGTINQIRHLMQGKYEVYQLPPDKFNPIIQQLNPDADAHGVAMADFNGKPTILIRQGALPETKWHELLHPVYDALSPDAKAEVDKASFSRNDPDAFASSYQTQLTGKPTEVKYNDLPPEQQQQVRSEMAAETLGNLSIAQITQKPSVARQIQGLFGRAAESLGLPTTTGEVRSIVGVQPTFKAAYVLENALRDQASQVGPVNYGQKAQPATTTLPTDKNATTASQDSQSTPAEAAPNPPTDLSQLNLTPGEIKELRKGGMSDADISRAVTEGRIMPTPTKLSEVQLAPKEGAVNPVQPGEFPNKGYTAQDGPSNSPDAPQSKASVPVMITKAMEAQLKARGISDAEIYKMTPSQANDILNSPVQDAQSADAPQSEIPNQDAGLSGLSLSPEDKSPKLDTNGDVTPVIAASQTPGEPITLSYYDKDGRDRTLQVDDHGDAHSALQMLSKEGSEVHAVNGRIVGKRSAEDLVNSATHTNPDLHAIRQAAKEAKRQELAGTKRKTKDAEIQKAGLMAMAKAHEASDPNSVQLRTDRFGKEAIYGSRLDPSDPFHKHLISLAGLSPKQVDTINKFSASKGKLIGVENYAHAVKEGEATGVSRKQEQALNPAQERVDETGKSQNAPLNIIPSSILFNSPSNKFTLHGFNVDKFFGNAKKLLDLPESGASRVYDGINDPQWVKDVQAYRENNDNGYSGDGRKKLVGTELTPIKVNEDYKPTVIPTDRFQVLNAAFGMPAPKGKTGKGLDTLTLGKQNAAFVFPDTGEFNQVRNKLGDYAKNLEATSETLRPENIKGQIGTPVADEHLLRPTGVSKEQLHSFGTPPRSDYIAGGFQPSARNTLDSTGELRNNSDYDRKRGENITDKTQVHTRTHPGVGGTNGISAGSRNPGGSSSDGREGKIKIADQAVGQKGSQAGVKSSPGNSGAFDPKNPDIRFQPSANPRGLKAVAMKLSDGTIVSGKDLGDMHINLIGKIDRKYGDKADELLRGSETGWVTNSGEYLDRNESEKRALETGQADPKKLKPDPNGLESLSFAKSRKKSLKDLFIRK